MPRPRRKTVSHRQQYTDGQLMHISHLCNLCDAGFGDDTDTEFLIEQYESGARDVILAEWIRDSPGTRPPIFWMVDAPEPRRRIKREPLYEGDSSDQYRQEPELDYLRRNGLLEESEIETLKEAK